MALYTIMLGDLLRNYEIFGFPYPIYDEKERVKFETAFKQHFYFREICCPEPERFIWYLRDKMNTVFPYYNELMRTATIEYDVENPYNLTETYTRKTDSKGKAAGFMSSVGTSEGVQDSEGSETRESATSGNVTVSGNNSETENVKTETTGNESGSNTGSRNETATGETSGTNMQTSENSETSKDVKKYLDTPQGKLNLDTVDYLTNLTQEEVTRNGSGEVSNTTSGSETRAANVTENGSNERETEGTSETARTVNGSNGSETVSSGLDNSEVKTTGKVTQEEKTKADSNTRTESTGETVEEYTMTRKGNIGVNPASYEIDSHIKTQKTLKRIYEMFFDECEDLFMLVY